MEHPGKDDRSDVIEIAEVDRGSEEDEKDAEGRGLRERVQPGEDVGESVDADGGEQYEGRADEPKELADHDLLPSMNRAIIPLLIGPTSAIATTVGRKAPTPVWAAWAAMAPMPTTTRPLSATMRSPSDGPTQRRYMNSPAAMTRRTNV